MTQNEKNVTEATPLLHPSASDLLLPLSANTTNTANASTIVTADPDSNGDSTENDTSLNTTANSAAPTNGRRRQFLHRKLRRTMESSNNHNNGGGMDTSDGSRESTTSSLHSHLQSFREVSLRLIQYVAHHTGTNSLFYHDCSMVV